MYSVKQNHTSHLPFSSVLQALSGIEALFLDQRLGCAASYADSQTKLCEFDCSPCFWIHKVFLPGSTEIPIQPSGLLS